MRKYIFLLLIFPLVVFSKPTTDEGVALSTPLRTVTSYANYSAVITTSELIAGTGNVSGVVAITNDIFTLTINGTWTAQQLKLGVIKQLVTSAPLPDMELGPLMDSSGIYTGVNAKIVSNELVFYSSYFINSIGTQERDFAVISDIRDFVLGYENSVWNYDIPLSMGSIMLQQMPHDYLGVNLFLNTFDDDFDNFFLGPKFNFGPEGIVLPDTDLGPVYTDNGFSRYATYYKAKIENNWLVFYKDEYPVPPSSCNFSFTRNLNEPETWYVDADGDQYGNVLTATPSNMATRDINYVKISGDCDDSNSQKNPETKWYKDTDQDGIISAQEALPFYMMCSPANTDYTSVVNPNFNYTHAIAYDLKGNVTGVSRTYFDELGKADVSLSKDVVQNRIWGTETQYDTFGRSSKTTFTAPSPAMNFDRVNFFNPNTPPPPTVPSNLMITNPITASQDFTATQSLEASSVISPNTTVGFIAPTITLKTGFSATAGFTAVRTAPSNNANNVVNPSVQEYYSNNNTLEPYQATAEQPYSETNYDSLNPGQVINVVGGNKIDNEWKTGYSYTFPAAQEMYYVYGYDYYPGTITAGKEEIITKFYKTVSIDANGVENVSFTDGEGKSLAAARSGTGPEYPVISLIGTQGFVDVHIPTGTSPGVLIGVATDYRVFNLKTGALLPSQPTLASGNAYRIEAITKPTTDPKVYVTNVPSGGALSYDSGAQGITYNVNYYEYTVNVYNKVGQLVKNIQPKGYVANTVIRDQPTHMLSSATDFISKYEYNDQGQLKLATSPDQGTSKFAYRNDGQIRYSQSALQADTKVSYTNYDDYARPIESGVITGANGIWGALSANPDAAIPSGNGYTFSEQTGTIYDYADNNTTSIAIPPGLLASTLTTSGISPANYVQKNLAGNVVCTFVNQGATINAITWYSYDAYGRVVWVVQFNEDLGAKTIDYEYDYKGNAKKVIFQKDQALERFVHQYTYDLNKVLTKVETSKDNINFTTHADYSYYLTGELKRACIGQGLQGLDYVYTLGGQLKSINHPSLEPAKDPGHDAVADIFGLTLDYYSGDYTRANTNIVTSPNISGINQDFNGNIKAMRWANQNDIFNASTNQNAYMYNYNRNGWLTDATFGSTNNTGSITPATRFSESGLTYDANGNIETLQRTNDTGTAIDNLIYNYDPVNRKNQLRSVTDLVDPGVTYDIDTQGGNNYEYNGIGQMTRNVSEDLNYSYNTQGLTTEVKHGSNTVVKFFYNERGQRIRKEGYNASGILNTTEYYVLDLSGNAMAIYNRLAPNTVVQTELSIYGLSRLGVYVNNTGGGTSDVVNYQITDHLGNVRAVVQRGIGNPTPSYMYKDYYPFGEKLPFRDNILGNYRYAYQGQELDTQTEMEAFQLRLWDGRIGRWLNPDPKAQYASTYLGMGNNPINGVDNDGAWFKEYPNSAAYYKENPYGKLDGKDGHWLFADRMGNSSVWNTANLVNLKKSNGYKEYTTISQRAFFYGWFQKVTEARGFETKWAGAAYVVATQMSMTENGGIATFTMSKAMKKFAYEGNTAIFVDAFPKLAKLYNGRVLKGFEADQWDATTLFEEQFLVVDPVYRKQSKETIQTLQKMANQKGIYSLMSFDALKFTGDITNPQHRYMHGMRVAVPFWVNNSKNW